MEEAELVLRLSWERLINDYASGKVVLRTEKDMENAMKHICMNIVAERGLILDVARQEKHRGKVIDLRIGDMPRCIWVQLKFYHDEADWKQSPSMMNTVESDLKFAEGHGDTFVAIINTIPSTSRVRLPFKLDWQTIEIDRNVFEEVYSTINPRTSPPREMRQKAILVNGTKI